MEAQESLAVSVWRVAAARLQERHANIYRDWFAQMVPVRLEKDGEILLDIPVTMGAGGTKTDQLYQRLVSAGDSLMALIRRSKGRDNKTLEAFIDAINKLKDKYHF